MDAQMYGVLGASDPLVFDGFSDASTVDFLALLEADSQPVTKSNDYFFGDAIAEPAYSYTNIAPNMLNAPAPITQASLDQLGSMWSMPDYQQASPLPSSAAPSLVSPTSSASTSSASSSSLYPTYPVES